MAMTQGFFDLFMSTQLKYPHKLLYQEDKFCDSFLFLPSNTKFNKLLIERRKVSDRGK
jgi:hypothetical protein